MDFESLKQEYYALKPPVYAQKQGKGTENYVIEFSETDKKIIKSAKLPEGMTSQEAMRNRHKLLVKLYNCMDTPEQEAWVSKMLVNETSGFIKKIVQRFCFDNQFYFDMMNAAFMCVLSVFSGYNELKAEEMTLSTYLTRPLQHTLKQFVNNEKFKSTDHKSNNARKVQYAKDFLAANGNLNPTINDIKLITGMTEKTIVDALYAINASVSKGLDDSEVLGLESSRITPIEHAIKSEQKRVTATLLSQFSEFEQKCVDLKFDFSGTYGEQKSVAKIAAILNTTSHEVNKAIQKVFRMLKRNQEYRNLMYGEEEYIQKKKPSDPKKINSFFGEILDEMDGEDEPNSCKSDTNDETDIKFPWK